MMNQIVIMEMPHGICTVIQAHSFVMFFGIDYDKK